eukprot:GDKI01001157.1.p1 GENE.GDKI01001157.1~~GDKI01001157.1.p1  ORF type:complete len:234 (-),score=32.13 GDKI01001157.1:441-1142(-)
MASYAAKYAASSAMDSALRGVRNQFSTGAATASHAQGPLAIDWTNFNYPPGLRVIHYDLSELKPNAASIVWWIHLSAVICFVAHVLNIIDSIVLAIGGRDPLICLYTFLNILIFAPLAGYVFYQGYKGIASVSPSSTSKFQFGQGFMGIVYIFMAIVPWGCQNGFVCWTEFDDYPDMKKGMKDYWSFAIIAESCLHLINLVLACVNLYRVQNYNPFASSSNYASGGGRGTEMV